MKIHINYIVLAYIIIKDNDKNSDEYNIFINNKNILAFTDSIELRIKHHQQFVKRFYIPGAIAEFIYQCTKRRNLLNQNAFVEFCDNHIFITYDDVVIHKIKIDQNQKISDLYWMKTPPVQNRSHASFSTTVNDMVKLTKICRVLNEDKINLIPHISKLPFYTVNFRKSSSISIVILRNQL